MKEKKRLIKNKVDIERLMACLVAHFKQIFKYFKHTYTHFYSLFHPCVYQKYSKNITQTPLSNTSFLKIQKAWDCFIHEKHFFFFKAFRSVWFVFLNNHFQFLNIILHILTHFFTHTYFYKYFQTTIFNF